VRGLATQRPPQVLELGDREPAVLGEHRRRRRPEALGQLGDRGGLVGPARLVRHVPPLVASGWYARPHTRNAPAQGARGDRTPTGAGNLLRTFRLGRLRVPTRNVRPARVARGCGTFGRTGARRPAVFGWNFAAKGTRGTRAHKIEGQLQRRRSLAYPPSTTADQATAWTDSAATLSGRNPRWASRAA